MQLANQQVYMDIILPEINYIPEMQANIYPCLMDGNYPDFRFISVFLNIITLIIALLLPPSLRTCLAK